MPITVKEQYRIGTDRVNVAALDGGGKVIYERSDVSAAEWDIDPSAIAAKFAEQMAISQTPPPSQTAAVNKNSVTLSDAQIAAKLAALTAAKLAAEKVNP